MPEDTYESLWMKRKHQKGTVFCPSSCLTLIGLLSLWIPNPGFHSLAETVLIRPAPRTPGETVFKV